MVDSGGEGPLSSVATREVFLSSSLVRGRGVRSVVGSGDGLGGRGPTNNFTSEPQTSDNPPGAELIVQVDLKSVTLLVHYRGERRGDFPFTPKDERF